MKNTLRIVLLTILFAACDKPLPPPPVVKNPEMHYVDFGNKSIAFGGYLRADLDNDAHFDLSFTTMILGDPITQSDRKQYLLNFGLDTYNPVNAEEKTPVLAKGAVISDNAFSGYNWYNASQIMLSQKVITATSERWEGDWKNADHQYIALCILKNNSRHYGWVEISFNTETAKLTVHRSGVSKTPEKPVLAGS
ncbi:MAG TPA: hypothetical protein VLC98_10360 [Phnomibacter sp.]|nr:hypothetical protein [Phnomibacter sp.]